MWSIDNSDDDICSSGWFHLLSAWQQLWRVSEQVMLLRWDIWLIWACPLCFLEQNWCFLFHYNKCCVWKSFSRGTLHQRTTSIYVCVYNTIHTILFMVPSSHQSAAGYYRVSSYFFAKILCDLLPMRFLPVIFFSAISYWMIGELWTLSYL